MPIIQQAILVWQEEVQDYVRCNAFGMEVMHEVNCASFGKAHETRWERLMLVYNDLVERNPELLRMRPNYHVREWLDKADRSCTSYCKALEECAAGVRGVRGTAEAVVLEDAAAAAVVKEVRETAESSVLTKAAYVASRLGVIIRQPALEEDLLNTYPGSSLVATRAELSLASGRVEGKDYMEEVVKETAVEETIGKEPVEKELPNNATNATKTWCHYKRAYT